jgi:hypothetical protein
MTDGIALPLGVKAVARANMATGSVTATVQERPRPLSIEEAKQIASKFKTNQAIAIQLLLHRDEYLTVPDLVEYLDAAEPDPSSSYWSDYQRKNLRKLEDRLSKTRKKLEKYLLVPARTHSPRRK